ncbi:hypothetical protein Pres01_51630 [Metapseudomonas resinovorans]|uniref:hypothetical protein n=1 Tax=Metapseudomonas resinovorans TaxID=53412 RepID=UPI001F1B7AFF|nr:hypothetical protein [Pseudomonas resinovorans]GLZ89112.1 hypothetical protein Pres01_51630 [Pseudomonas resinovorans]
MLRLETNSPLYRVGEAVRRRVAREEDAPVDLDAMRQGIRVSLSELGKTRAAQKNDDIDQSSLPDGIKELLKLIRALKAQIAERQAELEAIAADQSLDEETRLQRLEALRGELASLQGALSSANLNLAKAIRDAGLSDEQSLEVGKLLNA